MSNTKVLESYQIRYLADIIKSFRKQYPLLKYHIMCGDTAQVAERLLDEIKRNFDAALNSDKDPI